MLYVSSRNCNGTYIYQSCWPRFIFRCISFRYPFRRYAWETLAEDIEGLDFSAVESLKASGANKIKTLVFAVIPQIMPAFLSLILYRFELNLRSASILGLIGAGGIGTPLIFAIQTRSWDRVGIILIGLVLMVAIVDLISGSIRKRIV